MISKVREFDQLLQIFENMIFKVTAWMTPKIKWEKKLENHIYFLKWNNSIYDPVYVSKKTLVLDATLVFTCPWGKW